MPNTRFALPLLAILVSGSVARADVVILVAPSVGPNIFNSPNYEAYRDNSLAALASGAASAGVPNTPGFYQAIPSGGSIPLNQLVVTDFPSWLGRPDPAAAFGSPFANETGTRLYFGLAILPVPNTPPTRFSISQLGFRGTTSTGNVLDDGFTFPAGFYEYSEDYVGLIFNPDGSVSRVTSGRNTQLVDALVGRGASNAFEALSQPGLTNQQAIDQALPGEGFDFTGTYTLGDLSGSATVSATATPIPVPPSCVLLGLGCAGLALRRFRR